jgi:DNA repair photolyase
MPRAVANPPNPFHQAELAWDGPPPPANLEVYEESVRDALSKNDSPDIPFTYSCNPYRGCFHGCAYCYARPSHQYSGFGAGTDFERRLVVKVNVADRLRAALGSRRWRGEGIVFSGNTDCYQPLEASYGLTRACLSACLEYRNPVAIITKSKLVRRDLDLLVALSERARCHVTVSVPFADDEMARKIEPYASSPTKRFETLRALAEAGIATGISLGPVIPGLNDDQIPAIVEQAAEAGVGSAFMIVVRLPREVLPVFEERLEEAYPLRAPKVRNAIRELRGGRANDPRFGARMRGDGPRYEAIESLFRQSLRRFGLAERESGVFDGPTTFRRPNAQLDLFR